MPDWHAQIYIDGLDEVEAMFRQLPQEYAQAIISPALAAMARIVRGAARRQNFGFKDRSGELRRTIRSKQIPATYFGKRYNRGRSIVFAGGRKARQAYLVEAGHEGPFPADPHPYLVAALVSNETRMFQAFIETARKRFPTAVMRALRRANPRGIGVFARTVSRRGRRLA